MFLLLGFAFVAGIFTILAPCIWPILPAVVSVSSGEGKYRPLLVVSGLITTFAVLTLFTSWLVSLIGVDPNALRWVAVVILVVLGLTMVVPAFAIFFERAVGMLSRLVGGSTAGASAGGWHSFVSGMALGIVWTPCAGPILATIATLAATQAVTGQVILLMAVYNLGVAIPVLLLAYGGQALITRTRFISSQTGRLQKFFGIVIIATAILIGTGYDVTLQAKLLNAFPFLTSLSTRLEETDVISGQLNELAGREGIIESTDLQLKDQGPAPELTGIVNWLNVDQPLTIADQRGKVVLIDFWTYTCINCIRTLPYLTTWQEKYADDGLVIIGVHTPEFEFEKSAENVQQAIEKHGIEYAVAQDNDYATWRAFENRFWPAKYLIDAQGHIRYVHFGEGAYEETEQAIQQLLKEAGLMSDADSDISASAVVPAGQAVRGQTAETYLGYLRARELVNQEYRPDQVVDYSLVPPFTDTWSLDGPWRITEEHAISESDQSRLQLKFSAKEVYLVVEVDQPAEIGVKLNGEQQPPVQVTQSQLYTVISSDEFLRNMILELDVPKGVRLFAFTFGG